MHLDTWEPSLKMKVMGQSTDIERNHWLCHLCNSNLLGDEYHYLFECTHFSADRRNYIQRYYFTHPNTYKLQELINNKDISVLTKLAIFCKIVLSKFR